MVANPLVIQIDVVKNLLDENYVKQQELIAKQREQENATNDAAIKAMEEDRDRLARELEELQKQLAASSRAAPAASKPVFMPMPQEHRPIPAKTEQVAFDPVTVNQPMVVSGNALFEEDMFDEPASTSHVALNTSAMSSPRVESVAVDSFAVSSRPTRNKDL